MRLAHRFLLVSAATLLIPWAGCRYVRDVESSLRQGQAETLAAAAAVTAKVLQERPSLATVDPGRFRAARTPALDVYAYPLDTAPALDGFADDWAVPAGALATLDGPGGLRVRYQAGSTGAAVYLYLEVHDTEVVYGTQPDADRVRVRVRDRQDRTVDLLFATPAPGRLQPVGAGDRVQANWQPTSRGYNLEIRLPADVAGQRLGFLVADHDTGAPSASAGTLPDLFTEPGWLIRPLDEVTAELVRLVRDGQRLQVIDPAGYVLAEAGNVEAPGRTARLGFAQRIVRFAVGGPPPGDLTRDMPPGRVDPAPVAAAFNGEAVDLRLAASAADRMVLTSAQPLPAAAGFNLALIAQEDSELILSLTDRATSRLLLATVSASVAATLSLLGFAAWLSWRIRRLSRASRKMVARERALAASLPESDAADELGDLARDLSHLLAQIDEYNAYLKGLGDKLTHELRTPLAVVGTSLDNLQADTGGQRAGIYLRRAREGIDRMQSMVAALGAATRTEEAIAAADEETFDLVQLVAGLGAAYRDSHPRRRIEVLTPASPCLFTGAPELIAQMLDKLIENALEFCPPDGQIRIELAAGPDTYRLGVSNTGSRLPPGPAARLFDSMVSAREDHDASPHLGLGLHIAQLIARRHDGVVDARNLPQDAGVEVFATFRRRNPAPV